MSESGYSSSFPYNPGLQKQWEAIGKQMARATAPSIVASFQSPGLMRAVESANQAIAKSFIDSGAYDTIIKANKIAIQSVYGDATKSLIDNLARPNIDWGKILPHAGVVPPDLLGQVAEAVSDALVDGRVQPELSDEAAKFTEDEAPEFSDAVQNSVDGVVAWDAQTKEHVMLVWRISYFIIMLCVALWMSGALSGGNIEESVWEFLKFLLGGKVCEAVFKSLKIPDQKP